MGVVLAFVLQCLQEERIDGLIRNLGEDDLRTRAGTAGGLLDCGKAALPALSRILENPASDEVQYRVRWLIERILGPILEEFRQKYGGPHAQFSESESSYFPGCRVFQWFSPCNCHVQRHADHGSASLVLCFRDGQTFLLQSADAKVLRRYLRPIKNKTDAAGFAKLLFGRRVEATAEESGDGLVVQVGGLRRLKHIRDPYEDAVQTLRFDREGRLVSMK